MFSALLRWSQPVDATLYLKGEMECALMGQRFHRGFTAAEKKKTGVIRCHTRRSIAVYLYKPAACSRKSCLAIFDRSARCAAPSRSIRMAIDGGISRISSQSVSGRRRLMIGRCLAIGRRSAVRAEQQLHRDPGRASYALRDVGQGGRQGHPDGRLRAHQAGEEATKGAV